MIVGTYYEIHYSTHISLIITSYSIRLYISAPFPKHIIYFHVSQPLLMPCLCLECPPPTSLSGKTLLHWWGSNSDVTCFFTDHPNSLSHSCLWPPLPPLFLLVPLFSIYHTALLLPICCYLYTCILWILLGRNHVLVAFGSLCLAEGLTHTDACWTVELIMNNDWIIFNAVSVSFCCITMPPQNFMAWNMFN